MDFRGRNGVGDDGIAADHRAYYIQRHVPIRATTHRFGGIEAPPPLNRASDPKLGFVEDAVDFNRDIRPIFEKSCLNCHSGEKPKGGFDLSNSPEP